MMQPNDQKRPFHEGGKVGRKNATLIELAVSIFCHSVLMKFVQLTVDDAEVVKFGTEKVVWWYNLLLKRHLISLILFSKFNHSDFGLFGCFLS